VNSDTEQNKDSSVGISVCFGSLFALALLLMCGCVSTQKPEPMKVDKEPLAPGDCIVVVFDLERPLRQLFIIDASGNVSLFYIGEIHLAGLTPKQAAQRIYDAYVPKENLFFQVSVRRCQRAVREIPIG
jgi:protein involved in polysaccharide export with SLBB domain